MLKSKDDIDLLSIALDDMKEFICRILWPCLNLLHDNKEVENIFLSDYPKIKQIVTYSIIEVGFSTGVEEEASR